MAKYTHNVSPNLQKQPIITDHDISPDGTVLTVKFRDIVASFHAQWLWDARCEPSASRDAATAFCQTPSTARIREVNLLQSGVKTKLEITWSGWMKDQYPAVWLRVLAPVVAKHPQQQVSSLPIVPTGWRTNTIIIPEISYEEIMDDDMCSRDFSALRSRIFDTLLLDSEPGILKVANLPPVDTIIESSQKGNLLTAILRRLFGHVFQHPRRDPDATFKIASHYHESASRVLELPNYDISELLLPHTDHSHYHNPVRIQGLHAVEGSSVNTFVDGFSVLSTLKEEDGNLYDAFFEAPMVLGRVAQFYKPPLGQTTVDVAVRMTGGFSQNVQAVRWHPHLAGYLLSPFERFEVARRSHCKFQEIMKRDSHILRTEFKPGDLYLWDNFRILHGREKTLNTPRLAIGQTVIEQTVSDEYRAIKTDALKEYVGENWLVQTPMALLNDMLRLIAVELQSCGDINGIIEAI